MSADKENNSLFLKPIELDKLYKDRDYDNIYITSLFICRLTIILNFLIMCYRMYLLIFDTQSNIVVSIILCILHLSAVVYAIKVIKTLKLK